MKTKISILAGIIALTSVSVYASSGNTNSSGCHNSKKEGYHCHGGSSISSDSSTEVAASANSTVKEEKKIEAVNIPTTKNLTSQEKLKNTLGINFTNVFVASDYTKNGNFYYYKPKTPFHSFENYYIETKDNKISKIFADQQVSEVQCKSLTNYLENEILKTYGKTTRINKSNNSTFLRYNDLDFVIMCDLGKMFYIVVKK